MKINCNTCNVKLALYSIIGIKIMDITFLNNECKTIDVQNVPSGTYFIKGQIEDETISHKAVIIH